jgi:hypothetical protein
LRDIAKDVLHFQGQMMGQQHVFQANAVSEKSLKLTESVPRVQITRDQINLDKAV